MQELIAVLTLVDNIPLIAFWIRVLKERVHLKETTGCSRCE
jgi:hypothetical protein